MVLLGADVMTDLLRDVVPATTWLASIGAEKIVLPGFVALELFQGCHSKAEQQRVEQTIDTLVAHTALMPGQPLHTFNQQHYIVVPALQPVQPYSRTVTPCYDIF